ncbi:hypothetical protein APHAL10511_002923 [Amanita phalloides]|nr:hypothetical protein APHAL10511_002923 [Amanita phalloides]
MLIHERIICADRAEPKPPNNSCNLAFVQPQQPAFQSSMRRTEKYQGHAELSAVPHWWRIVRVNIVLARNSPPYWKEKLKNDETDSADVGLICQGGTSIPPQSQSQPQCKAGGHVLVKHEEGPSPPLFSPASEAQVSILGQPCQSSCHPCPDNHHCLHLPPHLPITQHDRITTEHMIHSYLAIISYINAVEDIMWCLASDDPDITDAVNGFGTRDAHVRASVLSSGLEYRGRMTAETNTTNRFALHMPSQYLRAKLSFLSAYPILNEVLDNKEVLIHYGYLSILSREEQNDTKEGCSTEYEWINPVLEREKT